MAPIRPLAPENIWGQMFAPFQCPQAQKLTGFKAWGGGESQNGFSWIIIISGTGSTELREAFCSGWQLLPRAPASSTTTLLWDFLLFLLHMASIGLVVVVLFVAFFLFCFVCLFLIWALVELVKYDPFLCIESRLHLLLSSLTAHLYSCEVLYPILSSWKISSGDYLPFASGS